MTNKQKEYEEACLHYCKEYLIDHGISNAEDFIEVDDDGISIQLGFYKFKFSFYRSASFEDGQVTTSICRADERFRYAKYYNGDYYSSYSSTKTFKSKILPKAMKKFWELFLEEYELMQEIDYERI
jgi:hypothetical protein